MKTFMLMAAAALSMMTATATFGAKPQKQNESAMVRNDAIHPGEVWLDTDGKPIQAHGFSVIYDKNAGLYYWYGEDKTYTTEGSNVWTYGIRYYSSSDFYNWKDCGHLILPDTTNVLSPLHPSQGLDRPHIIYCPRTGKYVCWIKNLGDNMQFYTILQADRFTGPYILVNNGFRPNGYDAGDFDLYLDELTGKGYIWFERPHWELICCELSDDFTNVKPESPTTLSHHFVGRRPPLTREAPTHFVHNGTHYLFTSGTSGYTPNESMVCRFADYHGEYTELGNPHPNDTTRTSFCSQITDVVKIPGTRDLYIAVADRWQPEMAGTNNAREVWKIFAEQLKNHHPNPINTEPVKIIDRSQVRRSAWDVTVGSRYVFLPIVWKGDKPEIEWKDSWRLEDYGETQEEEHGQYNIVKQQGGQTLGYSPTSGVKLIEKDGFFFKDLNRNGKLDVYEDWRREPEERASNLASQLSIEEIAGLMLYSTHQSIPGNDKPGHFAVSTYGGTTLAKSGLKSYDITDQQKSFLKNDNVRHVLVTSVESPEVAARWSNNVQAYVEGLGHGIPVNNSSDPRHGASAKAEFDFGNGGTISLWPSMLGMAATFSPALVKQFAHIASAEYRSLGLTTALSPQIDIATDPRWFRNNGTFGEEPRLVTDMARAYCDGLQASSGNKLISDGWGYESVVAMVKHWPGGGSGEGGRDAHYGFGKYAVFPGGNMELGMKPFIDGAFKLEDGTRQSASVMPYYTISYGQTDEQVGNSYSHHIITDLLRDKYHYDGVVCTDWGVTGDETSVSDFSGKCWGVENLSVAGRHYKALMAGVDQFGGNNDKEPVLEAYRMGCKEHGEKAMSERFRQSARRLLLNIFRMGLFENPYLDIEQTKATVGNPEFMKAGYEAQLKSIVMLKNKGQLLPLNDRKLKVYCPQVNHPSQPGFFGMSEPYVEEAFDKALLSKYFQPVNTPEEADFAIVRINTPVSGNGYSEEDRKNSGNGYVPLTLQYLDYTATNAREKSIAGGDPYEDFTNRSYRGKTVTTSNRCDLDSVIAVKQAIGAKPLVVVMNMDKPFVVKEFEPLADAILVTFDCQDQAVLDILSGKVEPSGLMPMQLPADMTTVEEQQEDTPRDMRPYTDSEGNVYDFAFGINWKGVINDQRAQQYK